MSRLFPQVNRPMLNSLLKPFFFRLEPYLRTMQERPQNPSLNQQLQRTLMAQWLLAKKQGITLYDDVSEAGFRCYSQFEEDGIILYLLTMVGIKNRTVVEMCCGRGNECMAANLIINHGFKGYLFDGDKANVEIARRFFGRQPDCLAFKPEISQAWITRGNINQLLEEAGITGEVDVLSLDVDGNDYYFWEAITAINPRVCVFETHDVIPTQMSLTIPYSDDFHAMDKAGAEREFRSVSLAAMANLSSKKGYTLVGSHRHGFNVFFVRNDLLNEFLPRPSLDRIHDNEWTRQGRAKRWPAVKNFPWVSV